MWNFTRDTREWARSGRTRVVGTEGGRGTERRRWSGEHESHATAIHRGGLSFCRFDGTSTRHEESRGHEGKGTKEGG